MTLVVSLDALCAAAGVKPFDDLIEARDLYSILDTGGVYQNAYDDALSEGKSIDDADAAAHAALDTFVHFEESRAWNRMRDALLDTWNYVFERHCLTVEWDDVSVARVEPMPGKTWDDALDALVELINGVGVFRYADGAELRETEECGAASLDVIKAHLGYYKHAWPVWGLPGGTMIGYFHGRC